MRCRFEQTGGEGKPRYGQLTVWWAQDEDEARKTAHEWWPNGSIQGALSQALPLPDNVYVHQVGPDQAGFLRFSEREILPHASRVREAAGSAR